MREDGQPLQWMREKDGHDEGGRTAATMDEGEGRTR